MATKRLWRLPVTALFLLLVSWLSLLHVAQYSQAQGEVVLTKTLNRTGNVVRVGEVLSFTVILTNSAGFTLTQVRLVDQYDASVLGFAGATPPEDSHNPAAGLIVWNNVASPVNIAPDEVLTFTLFFTAEHPRTAVVNAVRAEDIIGTSGAISDANDIEQGDEAVGGAAPVVKFLFPPGFIPEAGLPVTFTHIITNNGAALMTHLPLTDTYAPNFLQFNFALPFTPNIITPAGSLVWTDLASAAYFGPIPADTAVVITTVFTATTRVLNTVNRASTEGALDQYNNLLAPGAARVPITIIDDSPAPTPTDDSDDDDQPVATATPAQPTPGPTAIATIQAGEAETPRFLPETGSRQAEWSVLLLIGLLLLTLGACFFRITLIPGDEFEDEQRFG